MKLSTTEIVAKAIAAGESADSYADSNVQLLRHLREGTVEVGQAVRVMRTYLECAESAEERAGECAREVRARWRDGNSSTADRARASEACNVASAAAKLARSMLEEAERIEAERAVGGAA